MLKYGNMLGNFYFFLPTQFKNFIIIVNDYLFCKYFISQYKRKYYTYKMLGMTIEKFMFSYSLM